MSSEPTYYIVYQTTNLVDRKIYIGAHQTSLLEDGYIGSGKWLKRAIKKYGIENFSREILFLFDNKEDMYQKEKELVTEEFLKRDDVYNLKLGGHGGFDHVDYTDPKEIERRSFRIKHCNEVCDIKYGSDWRSFLQTKEERQITGYKIRDMKIGFHSPEHKRKGTIASQTSEAIEKRNETFKRINHQQGERNSQYGTCWIWNDFIGSKRINKEFLPLYIEQGWMKGRKMCPQSDSN